MTYLLFVLALVPCMGAEGFAGGADTTGTSFEKRPMGALDVSEADVEGGGLFWQPSDVGETVVAGAVVTNYMPGAAYDYAAHGTVRNAYLSRVEPETNQFLSVDLDAALDRTILPLEEGGGAVSNVYLKTTDYDGIYADTLVKFSPSCAGPVVAEADRIVVWMRESELDDGRIETNLMITAGRYKGDYGNVEPADYRVLSPIVAGGTWCRLTIRAISDVTEYEVKTSREAFAKKSAGFTVYIDGKPVEIGAEDYDIGIGSVARRDILSPEARVLIGERRLFPGLAKAGTSRAVTLSRLSFAGLGAVDDVSFSTKDPGYAGAERVFTLNWDAGVSNLTCVVSNSAGVMPPKRIDASGTSRRYDIALGTNGYTRIEVVDVLYRADYSNGVWTADGGCTVTNNVFYAYGGQNPVGYMSSSFKCIRLGTNVADGCVATFAEAKALLSKTNGIKTIVLETDMVISNMNKTSGFYYDKGYFSVSTNEDLVLDLNGHTLQGQLGKANATVFQTGGKLLIKDSSAAKSGRILPPMSMRSEVEPSNVAVESCAQLKWDPPVLVIDAGWYDGLVSVTGEVKQLLGGVSCKAVCSIQGGSYTNVYGDTSHFYLDEYVTNGVPQYFGLVNNYWTSLTNGFVWCGAGSDDRWDNGGNWKGRAVPGAGDLAIFPPTNTSWNVDFGTGVATKSLWLDGDIAMRGTNEFSDVNIVSGTNRFVGTGVMTFTKKLPDLLTGPTGTSKVRLGAAWRGTVRISKITTPAVLDKNNAIRGWGNAQSKVEFNGVRGYVYYTDECALPYELVLTDDGTTPAWKNDTGFTGSTVSFPRLSGSGTLESSKNASEILQVLQFKDVRDFSGTFKFGGKRLLLGTGVVSSRAKAGHITFSKDVNVRSGLGWSGVNAHFGDNLYVQGATNDVLMAYTDKKSSPSVEDVTVMLLGPDGTTNECSLVVAGTNIVVTNVVKMARRMVSSGGYSVFAEDIGGSVKSGGTFTIPAGSAVAIVGNRVIVNGTVVSTFADYYLVQQIDGSTYGVEFDEDEATPTLAEFSVSETGDKVTIRVDNAQDGLWYGLQTVSSLDEEWHGPTEWKQPVDDTLTFDLDEGRTGVASFFRVLVTDAPDAK